MQPAISQTNSTKTTKEMPTTPFDPWTFSCLKIIIIFNAVPFYPPHIMPHLIALSSLRPPRLTITTYFKFPLKFNIYLYVYNLIIHYIISIFSNASSNLRYDSLK